MDNLVGMVRARGQDEEAEKQLKEALLNSEKMGIHLLKERVEDALSSLSKYDPSVDHEMFLYSFIY